MSVWLAVPLLATCTAAQTRTGAPSLLRKEAKDAALVAYSKTGGPGPTRLERLINAARSREAETRTRVSKNAPSRKPLRRSAVKEGHLKHTRHPLVVPTPKATRAYRRTFRILRRNLKKTDRYDHIILKHASARGLDPRLLKAIIAAESEFTTTALSPAGARGLMQLMPRTAEEMGVPSRLLTDPEHNIKAGAAYIEHLYQRAWRRYKLKGVRYQDAPTWVVQRVIAAYNAGPRFLYRDRWYRQTRLYVRKVLLFYQSDVTDIRRQPEPRKDLPEVRFIPSTSGALF